jgi:hypothetical protein
MLSQSMIYLTPASAARMQVSVGGVPVQIFSVHLEPYNTSARTTQLLNFMSWARGHGGAQLVGGDFNSWWGEYWILQMASEFHDTWRDITGSNENGYTIGNVRFDYWFRSFSNDGRVTPVGCRVPWTTLSDHRPVVADFRVRSRASSSVGASVGVHTHVDLTSSSSHRAQSLLDRNAPGMRTLGLQRAARGLWRCDGCWYSGCSGRNGLSV